MFNVNTATTTFTAPDINYDETLVFWLTVTDNEGKSHRNKTSVIVTDLNTDPVADAGPAQFVISGDTVTLDASASTDAESSITYSWLQTDSTGIIITLNDNTAEQPTFTAPVLTAAQTITFEVTVTDIGPRFDTATVNIAIIPVSTAKINDTGVTDCGDYAYGGGSWNDSNAEDCADATDIDGDPIPDGQDGHYGRDVSANYDDDGSAGFSFTKLDDNGDPLAQSAVSWSCVKDNVTGLIWEVKTTDSGLRDFNNTYTWYNSTGINDGGDAGTADGGSCSDTGNCDTEKYVASVNDSTLCGAPDWQLPTREQLHSLIDHSIDLSGPVLDTNYFPNTMVGIEAIYWSSLPHYSSSDAWCITFYWASYNSARKNVSQYVRLVRVVP